MSKIPASIAWLPNFEANAQWDVYNANKWVRVSIPWIYDKDWNQKFEIVTKLDLLNFKWLDDDWINKLIKNTLKIDIDNEEWIIQLNKYFFEWVEFIEKIWKNVLWKHKSKKSNFFTNKQDVINFCRLTTSKSSIEAFVNCLISKSIIIVEDVLNSKILEDLEFKKNFLISKMKRSWFFKFKKNNNNEWFLKINNKEIPFTLIPREKSILSTEIKIWRDPEFCSVDETTDDIWFTFYIEKKEDSLLFMQCLSDILYEWDFTVENKNSIDINNLWENGKFLNIWFFKKLKKSIKKNNPISSEWYSDINLHWHINIPNKNEAEIKWAVWERVWVEIKFIEYDSKWEDWLSFHPVYDYQKYLMLYCRLYQWYISEHDVDKVVEMFFFNLDENLKKKNNLLPIKKRKTKESYLKELKNDLIKFKYLKNKKNDFFNENDLKDWLKKYYLSKLIKVIVESKQWTFLTNEREFNLSLAWYRPKMKKVED